MSEYHCGGPDGWSSIFFFTATKDGTEWSPRFALYGDLGSSNARSLSYLQEETQRGHFDAILHVGMYQSISQLSTLQVVQYPLVQDLSLQAPTVI